MKRSNWFLFVCLTSIFALLFSDSLAHIITYHEQHSLFLFSTDFLSSHLANSTLRLNYLTAFILQFFYYPLLGACIAALLLSTLYLLTSSIVNNITGKNDPLQLSMLLPLFLIVKHTSIDFSFDITIGILITLLLLYGCSLAKGLKKYLGGILVITFHMYLIGWQPPLYALTGCLLAGVSALLWGKLKISGKTSVIITSLAILLYAGSTFWFFIKTFNNRERIIIQANEFVRKSDWEQVMQCASRYRGNNQLIEYFRNMALYHTGKMPYDLFDHPNTNGPMSLYLPWTGEDRRSEYGHYIYEQLGYINEAHRWAFESLVVNGETATNLINLIRYNIVNERPMVALRFIQVLKKTLFYRKQALAYEQVVYSGKVPGLHAIEHTPEEKPRFANVLNLGPELLYICEQNPTNQMGFEYLMSYLLLSKDIPRIAENIKFIENFNYPEVPVRYQEALLIYLKNTPETADTFLTAMIDLKVENRLMEYLDLVRKNKTQELAEKFGNTFWYYMDYTTPYNR